MSFYEFLLNLGDVILGGGGLLFALGSIIQITPIKVNPLSAIARWLGKKLCADVLEEMKRQEKRDGELSDEISTLRAKLAERVEITEQRVAIACRLRILQFGDELMHGNKKHSKELFDQILSDITEYESYCDTHPNFKNNKTTITSKMIKDVYAEHLVNNDFL